MKYAGLMFAVTAFAGAVAIANTASAAGPDAAHGKQVFARCAACHDLNTGKSMIGPSLKGIIGRTSGTVAGYSYSAAMKTKAVKWNPATLDAFLTAPMQYVSGTRMPFAGIPNAQDRADLIAYLQQAAH